jgi:energy-coupling factor transporter ATP-binding protein EcfA2
LQEIVDQPVDQLSAHTKRRVVLARALAADTRLIVLDDIESGFDSRYTERILAVLDAVRSRGTSTFLITTHDPKLGRLLADEVAVLADGKIVAYGPPDVVLDGIRTATDFHRCFGFGDDMVSAAAGGGASVRAEVGEFLLAREGKRPWPQVAPSTAWFVIGALMLFGLVVLALLWV